MACSDDEGEQALTNNDSTSTQLNLQFKFDPTQERLDNKGDAATIPTGNAAQSPVFNTMGVHFIELAPTATTLYKGGVEIYQGAATTAGGAKAIDFQQAKIATQGEIFHNINLASLPPGTYKHVRASISFQNYDIQYNFNNVPVIGDLTNETGRLSSFLGYNNYITTHTPKSISTTINDDKLQGFWAFETQLKDNLSAYNKVSTGASSGTTTVVNPLWSTVPIPAGSCVITGTIEPALVITGDETIDKNLTLSFSVNNSFEWKDTNGNGQWDLYYEGTGTSEAVVDMGLRGLKVINE